MQCWTCSGPAAAICRFCGRATCRDHARITPFVLNAWGAAEGQVEGLVVEDAIRCSACTPHPAPIRLDELLARTGGHVAE